VWLIRKYVQKIREQCGKPEPEEILKSKFLEPNCRTYDLPVQDTHLCEQTFTVMITSLQEIILRVK
jgi:hypothetical protein